MPYEVESNGFKTTVRLSEADAKARGLFRQPAPPVKVKPPAADTPAADTAAKEAKPPANKSRTAATKDK